MSSWFREPEPRPGERMRNRPLADDDLAEPSRPAGFARAGRPVPRVLRRPRSRSGQGLHGMKVGPGMDARAFHFDNPRSIRSSKLAA